LELNAVAGHASLLDDDGGRLQGHRLIGCAFCAL
jgi:hypothetical protein